MAIWLHFSFWGLSFDISALFRLSESGGRLLVTNGFHIGRAEFSVVIDRLTVLVDGFAVDSGIYGWISNIFRSWRRDER